MTAPDPSFVRKRMTASRPAAGAPDTARGPGEEMSLARLLAEASVPGAGAVPDEPVLGVTSDSRRNTSGHVFVALRGDSHDGAAFAAEAASNGAVAVVTEGVAPAGLRIPVVRVPDARRALARLSAVFHGWPSLAVDVAGVTGTNGKTTTSWLMQAALEAAGRPTGLVGTIAHDTGARRRTATNTTPPADQVQRLLAEMRATGRKACVMEVSSHGLVQGRVDAVTFRCGVFTNLGRDHLDYHGSMEEYLDAKADLFRRLPPEAVAVLNRDDPVWELLAAETRARVATYGMGGEGDYRARVLRMDEAGTVAAVRTPFGELHLESPLLGAHNVSNLLAALAGAVALGAEPEDAARGLAAVGRVPGRLERVSVSAPFAAFVDYAHTPDALERVLQELRPLVAGRLWVVFGCGGERDRGKRPAMARAVERFADAVMVTSDNPRGEHPMSIIREVMRGFAHPRNALLEPDRAAAIRIVLGLAQPGDAVLVAGKGHETCQVVGDRTIPFSDVGEVEAFFRTRT